MDEKELKQFLEWIPTKVKEFKGKSLEEVSKALNQLYQSDQGKKTVEALVTTYQQEKVKPIKFKNGGKTTKKCKCGCDIVSKHENGGLIEACACGCKSNVVKGEAGTKIPIQNQKSNDWGQPNLSEYKSTPGYYNGEYNAKQVYGNNKLYRQLIRNNGHYNNTTSQIITNPNTPKADTIYVSPRGNISTPKENPNWTNTFNNIFGYKTGGVLYAKEGVKVDKKVTEGTDDNGNRISTKVKTITNNKTGRVEKKVKTRTYLPGNQQAFEKMKTIGYQDESQVPTRFRINDEQSNITALPTFNVSNPDVSINVPQQNITSISAIPQQRSQTINFGGDFNSAFGRARKQGLSEFEWNGKRYGTQLKNEQSNSTPVVTQRTTVQPTKIVPVQVSAQTAPVDQPATVIAPQQVVQVPQVAKQHISSNQMPTEIPIPIPVTTLPNEIEAVTVRPRQKSNIDPIELAARRIKARQTSIKDYPKEWHGKIGAAMTRAGMNDSPLANFALAAATAGGVGTAASAIPILPNVSSMWNATTNALVPVAKNTATGVKNMAKNATTYIKGNGSPAITNAGNAIKTVAGNTTKAISGAAKNITQTSANFTPQTGNNLMNNIPYLSKAWKGIKWGNTGKAMIAGQTADALYKGITK